MIEKLKIHKLKILGGVLGVLVLVGAVFGGCKLGQKQTQPTPQPTPTLMVTPTSEVTPISIPTPDPTANWKTYTNTELGFSIKYPKEWFRQDNQIYNYDPEKAPGREFIPELDKGKFKINIAVLNKISVSNFQELSLKEWIEEHRKKLREELYGPGFSPEEKLELVVFDSLSGVKVETTGNLPFGPFLSVYFERGENVFEITAGLDYKSEEKTFNLMLSTFRFLE